MLQTVEEKWTKKSPMGQKNTDKTIIIGIVKTYTCVFRNVSEDTEDKSYRCTREP